MKKQRIEIRPTVLLLFGWMLLSDRVLLVLVILMAALLHEVGHVIAARLMHVPLSKLHMDILGARLEVSGRVLSYGEEWLLCAAGPLASLGVALIAVPFWRYSEYAVLGSCASLLLGLLNLLPIRTFDGGRMLESLLLFFLGERWAHRILSISTFLFLFLIWALAVYLLLRAGDGLSLLFFSMSLLTRLLEGGRADF